MGTLPQDEKLVVMCHHGGRSGRVVGWLEANGFTNAVNLDGGIDAWSLKADPAVPRY
jgi:rhodanese-related sulfurtransferase